ncbi:MAG: tRNA (N6-isopentenyl adenosine(37)-C2)-methylthiotransferase MiaB [Lachnospiraceae bacterium]|nr:tRNA (N6-isopentenyl adenosine(37)-C2)-methylthiotransferase MiaB [Lachnospiraceae bacterium]
MNEQDVREREEQLSYLERCRTLFAQLYEGTPQTACVVTFGCQMNARDSEKLIGVLRTVGYTITESEDADFVLYNTCSVRDNANQRLYGRLGTCGGYRKNRPGMRIGLCGCMAQEEVVRKKLGDSYPFVTLLFGTHNLYKFPEYLYRLLSGEKRVEEIWNDTPNIVEGLPTERKYRFKSGVNIMFGCNNFCTYCIVPYVRGREKSREAADILEEIRALAADGVTEVMLLGQNVNSYGLGLEGAPSFAQLLEQVSEVEGIRRIRFMTSHPKDLSEDLIRVLRDNEKVCKHLHLPLQSGSSHILKAMNRRYSKEKYLELALRIREEVPDLAMTTDIMVGFPGETAADVDDTLDVIRKVEFDNAFTFIYSKRPGTPASCFPNQPDEAYVKEQFARVLDLVQETSKKRAALLEGQVAEALVEEVNPSDASLVTGRLSNNMIVHFPGEASLVGSYQTVTLKECKGFYYLGERHA